jgi:hypothetical protein
MTNLGLKKCHRRDTFPLVVINAYINKPLAVYMYDTLMIFV